MYANYSYYTQEFGGTLIPENDFNRSVKLAGRYINQFTFNRICEQNKDGIEGLKDCACDMAESIYKLLHSSPNAEKEIKSETTDGYSVTYVTSGKDGEDSRVALRRHLYAIATLYLEPRLLYLGVDETC